MTFLLAYSPHSFILYGGLCGNILYACARLAGLFDKCLQEVFHVLVKIGLMGWVSKNDLK